jgi:hypothetical protein
LGGAGAGEYAAAKPLNDICGPTAAVVAGWGVAATGARGLAARTARGWP